VIATFDLAAPREWVDFWKELEGRPQGAFGQANPLRTNAKMRSAIDWAISITDTVRSTEDYLYTICGNHTIYAAQYGVSAESPLFYRAYGAVPDSRGTSVRYGLRDSGALLSVQVAT
jgi:hypothetical protein